MELLIKKNVYMVRRGKEVFRSSGIENMEDNSTSVDPLSI